MNIYTSGVNYRNTPLEIREKLSLGGQEQRLLLEKLALLPHVSECIILSTCNRTEVYVYSESGEFENSSVEKLLCEFKNQDVFGFRKYFYNYKGVKAVKHLFKVACGLDSLVLGEDQILNQVKSAHELSMELGTSSSVMNRLFREAVTSAKRIKTDTAISKSPVSIGSLAVKLIEELADGELGNKSALIIGTGKMGTIALKNLASKGLHNIYVTNRTHGKAHTLSKEHSNVKAVDYDKRYSIIDRCDIVISCTSSPHYTITGDMLEKAVGGRRKRIFIDLAVPRDFDISIRDIEGVVYYDIDDLKSIAERNIGRRTGEAARAEDIINENVEEYERWYWFQGIMPIVKDIQKYTERIIDEKISYAISKLRAASEEEKEIVRASITGTVNEMLNKFVYSIREHADKEDVEAYFRCLGEVMKEN